MLTLRKFLPTLAIMALAMVPATAKADFRLYLQENGVNGGAITEVASGADFGAISFTGTYGDFRVSIFGGTSDNTSSKSDLLSSTTSVVNTSGSAATLTLYASQTNYTLPAGTTLQVESGLGGSRETNTTLTLTNIFQAFADRNNNQLGMSDFTNGPQTGIPTGTTFDTGSATGFFNRDGLPYSLTSCVTLEMSGGGTVNYSNHINVNAAAVPAPAGLLLALSGLPCVALEALRRRRKNQA